ncbi:hypothetical protein Q5Y75_14610 [Ruegeria sp. 2205SS24-7]|uniref:hypothetical protein n=1 Tax=Ruegeria discodermiae TaxID=3064389 RepID=UPI002741BE4B|nr:hypothetical protein [Ruegeria sp. 2205SS24-7]MDP5218460.1 hypothetical protein [Ruegeria sp. 2205SS24-7]
MIRALIAIAFLCMGTGTATAQDPRVTAELESDSTIVGQPLLLRISILVPTWMPEPPVFPAVELPSLLVRQPERASGPISENIDGETWSGVRRSYRLYPLAGGSFTLPPGDVTLTYANPETNAPVTFAALLPELTFAATIPDGASSLDPLIIASSFELQQQLDGDTGLTVGGAATRTITAKITGTSPIMIPRLTAAPDGESLRAYPKDPQIEEKEDRGLLSGTRAETTTYVAQNEGVDTLPGLSLDWFNIETGQLETATVPAVEMSIRGAVSGEGEKAKAWYLSKSLWWVLGLGAVIALAIRVFSARAGLWIAALHTRVIQAEWYASHKVVKTISRRDLTAVSTALSEWKNHYPGAPEQSFSALIDGMASIGKARFGVQTEEADANWRALRFEFSTTRRRLRRDIHRARHSPQLHHLNPTWSNNSSRSQNAMNRLQTSEH